MPRNLVLCCDGTANQFAHDHTNVLKLYAVLDHDPRVQATYYHPGLGTMEARGAVTPIARRMTRLLGQAIGYGLERDVADAYVFLMNSYEPEDRVFLFGFSRGAYTVRVLASLLRMYGLLRPGNEPQIPYAIRMMTAIQRTQGDALVQERARYFDAAARFKAVMSRGACDPWFVGVWDTVSSVGWVENPLRVPYSANNPSISVGRHAIAIDERRAFFRTNLWRPSTGSQPSGPLDLKQVWFAGVHCDVGGGYPEAESSLSKIPLQWMLEEATANGLHVRQEQVDRVLGRSSSDFAQPDPQGILHESLHGGWHLAEFVRKRHFDWKRREERKRMNLYRRRTIPEGSLVHSSVLSRSGYSPRLPKDYSAV